VIPGQWHQEERELEDPGAGFMEVGMFALNMPGAPWLFKGRAIQSLLFHEVAPGEFCPCGSWRTFGDCHRNPKRVPLLCRDLGAETYSDIVACESTFPVHDDEAAVQALKAAPELNLTQEIRDRRFWQYIGVPPTDSPLGDIVFATVEWNPGRLYFVTLSVQRNEVILSTLARHAGEALGKPRTQQSDVDQLYRQQIRQKNKEAQ
jgi:hypothetical protein